MNQLEGYVRTSQFIHITLSCLSVLISFLYLSFSNYLLNIGYFTSPVIWFIPLTEILKVVLLKFVIPTNSNESTKYTSRDKKKTRGDRKNGNYKLTEAFQIAMLTCAGIAFFSVIAVILGAPVMANHEQTLCLGVLMASMTILPLALFTGSSGAIRTLFQEEPSFTTKCQQEYWKLIKNNIVGVILVAWGASIVAPLDWDREWQTYPIPNMIGALLGLLLANVYSAGDIIITPIIAKLRKETTLF